MKRLVLATILLTCLIASPALAHHWGTYDVTNGGRVASVWEQTKYDGLLGDYEGEMNSQRAGTHGVIFKNDGHSGTAGVDWEIHIYDTTNHPWGTGADYNYIWCSPTCISYTVITVSSYGSHRGVFHHEFGHSLSAPHEPCYVTSTVMHGAPYTPCPASSYTTDGLYGTHDLRNYRYNKSIGVYDESMGLSTLEATSSTSSAYPGELTKGNVVAWAKFNAAKADEVNIKHKRGGILVQQVYYPHYGK